MIKGTNVRPETENIQGKCRGELQNLGLGNDFLKRIPVAQEKNPARLETQDHMELKGLCRSKGTINVLTSWIAEWAENLCHLFI